MPDRRSWGPPDHQRFAWLTDEIEANVYAIEAVARIAGAYAVQNHTRMAQIIARQQHMIQRYESWHRSNNNVGGGPNAS